MTQLKSLYRRLTFSTEAFCCLGMRCDCIPAQRFITRYKFPQCTCWWPLKMPLVSVSSSLIHHDMFVSDTSGSRVQLEDTTQVQGGKGLNQFMQQSQTCHGITIKMTLIAKASLQGWCVGFWRTLFINKATMRCWVTWPTATIKCEWRTMIAENIRQTSKTSHLWKYHQSLSINLVI